MRRAVRRYMLAVGPRRLAAVPLVIFGLLLLAPALAGGKVCSAEASHHSPTVHYCYLTSITITNNTGSALFQYPVRIDLNASEMIGQSLLSPNGWDVRLVDLSLNARQMMAKGMDRSPSAWWTLVTLPDGASQALSLYTGNPYVMRDAGYLMGNATSTIATTTLGSFTLLDQALGGTWPHTTNLEWFATITSDHVAILGSSSFDSTILDRFAPAEGGYAIGIEAGDVYCRVGTGAKTNTVVFASWDGATEQFRCRFISNGGGTLDISILDEATGAFVIQDTDSTAYSQIGVRGATAEGGINFSGTIHHLEFHQTSTKVWTLHAEPPNLESLVSPVTNADAVLEFELAELRFGLWVMQADQAGITVEIGAVQLVSADVVSLPIEITDVLGDPFVTDVFAKSETNTRFPFYNTFEDARVGVGMPEDAWWFMIAIVFSIPITWGMYVGTKRYVWAAVVPTTLLVFFATQGVLAPWFAVIMGLMSLGIFLTERWTETA